MLGSIAATGPVQVGDISVPAAGTLFAGDRVTTHNGSAVIQYKAGARVVSYVFDMGDWQPKVAETYRDSVGDQYPLYLWRIGEPMVFSDNSPQILQPQPTRDAPLIIEVK